MIAQFLFTLALGGAWLYVHGQTRLSGAVRLALYGVIFAGMFFVWLPDESTHIANILGIGRGADMIYYIWMIISLAVVINIHLKLRQNLNLVTELARSIAIADASRELAKSDKE
ncbi:DUF2304 family protein [Telluria sp. B2]